MSPSWEVCEGKLADNWDPSQVSYALCIYRTSRNLRQYLSFSAQL